MAIDPFFGSVLSGAANIVGGLIGGENQRKANENARDAHLENLARQDEYAKRGVTYRVRDVMNAYNESGIHPLALLGVQGPTYSPSSPVFLGGNPVGEGLGRAGQDISRGLHATADRELRREALGMQAERYKLENDLIRAKIASEIALTNQVQNSPAVPSVGQRYLIPGQGATGKLTKDDPLKRVISDPINPSTEPGAVTGVRWSRTPTGWMPIKSKDTQEGMEDDFIGNIQWNVANRLIPMVRHWVKEKFDVVPFPAPEGKRWRWSTWKSEYQLVDTDRYTAYEGKIKY